MKVRSILSSALPLAFVVAACGAGAMRAGSPDTRLQEGQAKLDDILVHGGGNGTQDAADATRVEIQHAQEDKLAEMAATSAGIAARSSLQTAPKATPAPPPHESIAFENYKYTPEDSH